MCVTTTDTLEKAVDLYTDGTMHTILIQEGVFIPWMVLYTSLYIRRVLDSNFGVYVFMPYVYNGPYSKLNLVIGVCMA